WLRESGLTARDYLAQAGLDLRGGVKGNPAVVTNTHLPDDKPQALSYDALCRQICLTEAGSDKTWWELADGEAAALEEEISEGKVNPMSGAAHLDDWMATHDEKLRPTQAKAGAVGM